MSDPEGIVIVGAQWGDEGKGKIVELLSDDSDVVIRANGGDNAGHTIVNQHGETKLHLFPSGSFNPDIIKVIAPGVAVNLSTVLNEKAELEAKGVVFTPEDFVLSSTAPITFEYHQAIDRFQETMKGGGAVGTTGRGVGPAYEDKASRIGLKAYDLLNPDSCLQKIREAIQFHKIRYERLIDMRLHNPEFKYAFIPEYYEDLILDASENLGPFIRECEPVIRNRLSNGGRFLVEAAHATLLDPESGTYPFATSSKTTVLGALAVAGIPFGYPVRALGVYKAYTTRVGNGEMPTEGLEGWKEWAENVREKGHEYGTTTGRPRRVGPFDSSAASYSHLINGYTEVAITHLDILGDLGDVPVGSYVDGSGDPVDFRPHNDFLASVGVKVGTYPGFTTESITSAKEEGDLPEPARVYCKAMMSCMPGVRLTYLGTGQGHDDVIKLAA